MYYLHSASDCNLDKPDKSSRAAKVTVLLSLQDINALLAATTASRNNDVKGKSVEREGEIKLRHKLFHLC